MTKQFKNPLPSTIKNPIEILVAKNPMAPTKDFHEKTKLIEIEVIAKFQSLRANKSTAKALHVQLQVGKEKLGGVKMEFEKIRITTIKVEKKVATKAIDKMRLTKYNTSLGEGTLKSIFTIE